MQARTIEEAIELMDREIAVARRDNSRLGYFAALYRMVTAEVKQRCDSGYFIDNDRMRHLDVTFANRYLAALDNYRMGDGCTWSWEISFRAATWRSTIILQHLLLGMNAHIGLDLGVAVAEVAEGTLSDSLHEDFNKLNTLLASMVDGVQDRIGLVSPWLKLLDRLGWRADEAVVSFSIDMARDGAWRFAERLNPMPPADRQTEIGRRDESVSRFGNDIAQPGWLLRPFLLAIGARENKDIDHVLDTLYVR